MFYYEVSWFLIICSRLIFWMGNPSVFKTIKEFSSIYREAPDFINLSRSSLFHQSMQKLLILSIYRETPWFHQSIEKLRISSIYREAPDFINLSRSSWFYQSTEKLHDFINLSRSSQCWNKVKIVVHDKSLDI